MPWQMKPIRIQERCCIFHSITPTFVTTLCVVRMLYCVSVLLRGLKYIHIQMNI